jgi:hypothetical protein
MIMGMAILASSLPMGITPILFSCKGDTFFSLPMGNLSFVKYITINYILFLPTMQAFQVVNLAEKCKFSVTGGNNLPLAVDVV